VEILILTLTLTLNFPKHNFLSVHCLLIWQGSHKRNAVIDFSGFLAPLKIYDKQKNSAISEEISVIQSTYLSSAVATLVIVVADVIAVVGHQRREPPLTL
jgi:hypothetical protein